MKKLRNIVVVILFVAIGLPALGYLLKWLFPGTALGEAIIGISSIMWTIFKEFELGDMLQSVVLYIVIALALMAFGFTMIRKTESKVWIFVSLLMMIIAIITGDIL